jgi:hypothetical protein
LRGAVEWSANHGCLESRVLFDTVIVTSMNEGKFPAGKSQNSFIPMCVRIRFAYIQEKDAIYTYHFLSFTATLKKHLSAL